MEECPLHKLEFADDQMVIANYKEKIRNNMWLRDKDTENKKYLSIGSHTLNVSLDNEEIQVGLCGGIHVFRSNLL